VPAGQTVRAGRLPLAGDARTRQGLTAAQFASRRGSGLGAAVDPCDMLGRWLDLLADPALPSKIPPPPSPASRLPPTRREITNKVELRSCAALIRSWRAPPSRSKKEVDVIFYTATAGSWREAG
jgi:hypothetical protein